MWSVFLDVLQTNMGKHYVREQENTRDAQAVWRNLMRYMLTSTRADIEIEDLLTTLTSARLEHSNKNTMSFITTWLEQLRQYEDLTPINA